MKPSALSIFSILLLKVMSKKLLIPDEVVISKIYLIRGQKVMIDSDLAGLYNVGTKVLNQTVKRNLLRFPADFMFQLSQREYRNLRSQFVTSSWGGRRLFRLYLQNNESRCCQAF